MLLTFVPPLATCPPFVRYARRSVGCLAGYLRRHLSFGASVYAALCCLIDFNATRTGPTICHCPISFTLSCPLTLSSSALSVSFHSWESINWLFPLLVPVTQCNCSVCPFPISISVFNCKELNKKRKWKSKRKAAAKQSGAKKRNAIYWIV